MPILTGAGIVGLAIGFGAQNLVRDVISGFFLILEDQVRVGDVAAINGTGGLVEALNLRTIVLRDAEGTVHVFPNGSMCSIRRALLLWLIPLFLLIFGVSDVNKVAIAAFGALLIVLFNSAYGVMNARKQRIMAAKVMGASRWQIFKDVLIWESLQPTFVGLRSAVSMALVIVIVAEMFIGSDNGLGHRIIDAQQVMNVKSMYSAILAAGILGYTLNVLFLIIERRVVHWSGR